MSHHFPLIYPALATAAPHCAQIMQAFSHKGPCGGLFPTLNNQSSTRYCHGSFSPFGFCVNISPQCGLLFQLLLWSQKQPQNLVMKRTTTLLCFRILESGIQKGHSEDGLSLSAVTEAFMSEGDLAAGSRRLAHSHVWKLLVS